MNRVSRIGILGYGRFGSALAALVAEHRYPWLAWDDTRPVPGKHAAADVAGLLAGSDLIVVAVPVAVFADVLRDLRPRLGAQHQVMDVCSVKQGPCDLMDEVLGDDIPHVGCHPLFGPLSIARAEPLRTVVCPSPRHPAMAARVRALFESIGSEVTEMTPAAHDRHMAMTHAMAFFLARGLLELGVGDDLHWTPPSFAALASSIAAVRADAGHLFNAIQRENPYAAAVRRQLIEALARIDQRVLEAPVDTGVLSVPDVPAAGRHAAAPDEAHEHIEELDRELLALLQRRRELCVRAASAHADAAAARESDPEAVARSGESGLPPDAVQAVFRQIDALCRLPRG